VNGFASVHGGSASTKRSVQLFDVHGNRIAVADELRQGVRWRLRGAVYRTTGVGVYVRSMVDAFGQMLLGGTSLEIIERDDGFLDAVKPVYFTSVGRWPAAERRALRWVRGRVLDAGVGAGRVALELQRRGRSVVGIDVSPGAVEVARRRGVRDVRLLAFEDVDDSLGHFDTIAMFGNNFGLFGSPSKAKRLLRRLRPLADRIVTGSNDPYATEDPAHLAYQEQNRKRGRMPGQLRLRNRYRDLTGPWFDYLIVSPDEMTTILEGTQWRIRRLIQVGGSGYYVAVLE
jgi:SAM-dependent methyltransferase